MVTYNTVTVTGQNIFGNASGEIVVVTFTPESPYFDTPNNTEVNPPVTTVTSGSDGNWSAPGLIDPTPGGTGLAWGLTVRDKTTGQVLYSALVQLAFSNGASQHWLSLTPPPAPANTSTYITSGSSAGGALTGAYPNPAFTPYAVNASSNDSATIALSPVGYWHIGDVIAAELPDSSGNARNAAVTGTVTATSGPPGMTAGVFAANADFAATAAFSASLTAFAVEVWFNTSALANNVAMVSGGTFAQTTHTGFNLILFTDNNLYWDWGDGTTRHRVNSSGGPVTANTWHHAVGVFTGSASVLYLDGVKVASGAFTGPMSWPSPQVNFAQSFSGIGGTPHPISMANVAMFPAALTASQVSSRYSAGINGIAIPQQLGTKALGITTGAGNFDVLSYGATGDGITDDQAAIQAAITAAGNNGSGTVWFPGGSYYYTVTPQVTGDNIVLQSTSTAPLYGSTGGPVLMPKDFTIDGIDVTSSASQITLRNLRFVPKSATGGSGGAAGTCMVHLSGTLIKMENVLMPKAYNGVHIDGGNVTISQCTVNPLSVAGGSTSGNYCFFADGTGGGTGAFFDNCSAWTAETTPPGVTSNDADGYVFSAGYGSPVMRDCQALGTYRSIWCTVGGGTVGPGGLVVKGFTFDHTGTGIQLDALGFSGFFTDIIGTSSYNNPGGINIGAGVLAASIQLDNVILAAGPLPLVISPTNACAVNASNILFTNIGSSTACIECTGASTVNVSNLTTQLGGGTTSSIQLDAGFTGNFTAMGVNLKNGTNGLKTIAGGTGPFVIVGGFSQHDNSLAVTPAGSKVQFVSGMTSV